jgi:glycosyltransferase involved in cell wall biosynthesis
MADSVVAVAEWLADVLRSNGCDPAKLLVSRHGLDDEDLLALRTTRPSARSDRPLELGYVGRLDSTKGVDRVVRAMRLIDRSQPIKLSIYGAARNDEQRAYALKVRDLARGDERISFPGELTPANRARVFGSFDALVVPSVWFETGPLVVLEAFSAGIPVIGSARGGIAELVTDGVSGLLVDDLSAAGWAGAFRAAQARFARGQWQWRFPGTRSSQAVGAEMRRVYDSLWAEDLSRAA